MLIFKERYSLLIFRMDFIFHDNFKGNYVKNDSLTENFVGKKIIVIKVC